MIQSGTIRPQIFLPKNKYNVKPKSNNRLSETNNKTVQMPVEVRMDGLRKSYEYTVPVSYIYIPPNEKTITSKFLDEYTDDNDIDAETKKESIRLGLTMHTRQRMKERNISVEDIIKTIKYGLIYFDRNYPTSDCYEYEQPDLYNPGYNRILKIPVNTHYGKPYIATVMFDKASRDDPSILDNDGYAINLSPYENHERYHRNIGREKEREQNLIYKSPIESSIEENETNYDYDTEKRNMPPVSYIYIPKRIGQVEPAIDDELLREYNSKDDISTSIKKSCNVYGLTSLSEKQLKKQKLTVKDLIQTLTYGWIYFDKKHLDRYCYEYEQNYPDNKSKKRILKVSADYGDGIRDIVNVQVYNCSRNDPPIVNRKGHVCKSPPCKDIERYHRDLGREDKRNRRLAGQLENIQKEPVEDTMDSICQANYDKTIIETPPNITDILVENI